MALSVEPGDCSGFFPLHLDSQFVLHAVLRQSRSQVFLIVHSSMLYQRFLFIFFLFLLLLLLYLFILILILSAILLLSTQQCPNYNILFPHISSYGWTPEQS